MLGGAKAARIGFLLAALHRDPRRCAPRGHGISRMDAAVSGKGSRESARAASSSSWSCPRKVFGMVSDALSLSRDQAIQWEQIMDKCIAVVGGGSISGYRAAASPMHRRWL